MRWRWVIAWSLGAGAGGLGCSSAPPAPGPEPAVAPVEPQPSDEAEQPAPEHDSAAVPPEVVAELRAQTAGWRAARRQQRAAQADPAEARQRVDPASFLEGARPARPNAFFVRVQRALLAGDLDVGSEEEVLIQATARGRTRTLAECDCDLSDDALIEVPLPDSPLIEVFPSDPVELTIRVVEVDPQGAEPITRTPEPVRIPLAAFPPGEASRSIPLAGIPGARWVGVVRRRVILEGAQVTLGLLRVPRRDALDRGQRATIGRVFAGLGEAEPPQDVRQAAPLVPRLRAAVTLAREAVTRSVHTGFRDTLNGLAARCEELIDQTGLASCSQPAAVHRELSKLEDVLSTLADRERGPASVAETLDAAEALVQRFKGTALDVSALGTLASRSGELIEELEDALAALPDPTPSLVTAMEQVAPYLDGVWAAAREEREASRAADELADAWEDLFDAIEEAKGG